MSAQTSCTWTSGRGPWALHGRGVGTPAGGRVEGGHSGASQAPDKPGVPPHPTPRDHDDDVSLVEACRKLNEVIGLKGMSRYDRWDPSAPQTPGLQLGYMGLQTVAPQGPQVGLPPCFAQVF